MTADIALISSGREMKQIVESTILSLGRTSVNYPDFGSFRRNPPVKMPVMILIDLDSVKLGSPDLKGLKRVVGESKVIGVSVRSYHPHLKYSIQNGFFTALIKPPIEDELLYWINSLLGVENSAHWPVEDPG